MGDVNEIRALKASLRGAVDTAQTLAATQQRVEALDDHAEIDQELLDELNRVTAAHAVASAAVRGIVGTMITRRTANAGG